MGVELGQKGLPLPEPHRSCRGNPASQTRSDMVAMALAISGVTLAVAALVGFQVVRAAAVDAARDEARDRLGDMLPRLLTAAMIAEALRQNQPIYLSIVGRIRETIRLQGASDIKDSDADSIAKAAGDETETT